MSNTTQAHTNFGFLMEHSPLLHKLGHNSYAKAIGKRVLDPMNDTPCGPLKFVFEYDGSF